MKKGFLIVFLLCLFVLPSAAQTLPSVDIPSPGLARLQQMLQSEPVTTLSAAFSADELFHIRDLSLFQTMLEGTQVTITEAETEEGILTAARITRQGNLLLEMGITQREDGQMALSMEGRSVLIDFSDFIPDTGLPADGFSDWISGIPWGTRVPLSTMKELLPAEPRKDLISGWAVGPFVSQETWSDDGERLTRLDFSGSVNIGGEELKVEGFIRKPGGKSPKDTAEIHVTKDDNNTLTWSRSTSYRSETARKERQGTVTVTHRINCAGKLDGYAVSLTGTVKLTNKWTADGETLGEKETLSVSLKWQDKNPKLTHLHYESGEISMKNSMEMISTETAGSVQTAKDSSTLTIKGRSYTPFSVGIGLQITPGGEIPEMVYAKEKLSGEELADYFEEMMVTVAKRIYALLDQKARDKIVNSIR